MKPLVSIIIPTYNRANLLGETLDTVLAQTYTNWECIVVDDRSDDDTDSLMQQYLSNDSRFKYFHRPEDRPRGGNAARNYGFEMSTGELIQWFDSDDLMEPNKIEMKVTTLQDNAADFVISKTKYFNKDIAPHPYDFQDDEITFNNYAMDWVSWFTPDVLVKRTCVENVTYNEHLRAGQEYNFTCKLLANELKGKKINTFLTLRRWHEQSIGNRRKRDRAHYWETKFDSHWQTYLDIKKLMHHEAFEVYSLRKCAQAYCQHQARFKAPEFFFTSLKKQFGRRSYYLYLAKVSGRLFNRPYHFYNKLK